MVALIFDTCCGCIELRTGCLIIGYLNLAYCIIAAIMMLVGAVVVGAVASSPEFQQELAKHNLDGAAVTTSISIVAIIMVVLLLLLLIFDIVFLVGVHKNKRGHVKAYLIFLAISIVLFVALFFAGFAAHTIAWGNVVQNIIVILLSIYFFLVIRSYYYKMDDANRQPAIYNTA